MSPSRSSPRVTLVYKTKASKNSYIIHILKDKTLYAIFQTHGENLTTGSLPYIAKILKTLKIKRVSALKISKELEVPEHSLPTKALINDSLKKEVGYTLAKTANLTPIQSG